MVRRQDILVAFVCLVLQGSSAFMLDKRVGYDVSTKELYLEEGSNITITCIIDDDHGTADNLVIKLKNEEIDSSFVEILDSKHAKVHLINLGVDPAYHHQLFRCYLPDFKGLPDQIFLFIGRQPLQPRDVSCEILNWDKLTCKWQPDQKEQQKHSAIRINYSLMYHQDDGDAWLECPEYSADRGGCLWNKHDFTFGLPIRLNISVSNKLETKVLDDVQFDTTKIVKPGPVQNISITNISSRSAEITWSPPSHHNMSFCVTLTCQWHTHNVTLHQENRTKVTDLIPHTTYKVQVTAIPAQGGFWSDPSENTFKTLQDVPEDHPMVARGAYEVGQCGKNCRNITVYYKPLHEKHINGEGLAYNMIVKADTPCPNSMHIPHGDVYKLNISAHHITIPSRTTCSIRISITASNSNGMPQWPPDEIVVPSNASMFEASSLIVKAIDDKTIDLSWSPVDGAQSYTVYWCISGISTYGCHPKHELNWMILPGNVSHYRLNLSQESHFDNTKFALSVLLRNHSSPLKWAGCTYDERQGGEVPQLEKETHQEFTSVSVRWTLPKCPMGNHRGYVHGFNLSYCRVESCPSQEQLHGLECKDTLKSLQLDRQQKDKTIDGLPADHSYMLKISSLSKDEQSEWSTPVCHTVTDTWFKGAAIVGVAIGVACGIALVILGVLTTIYRFKSLHKWYTTGLDIKVPERHMTFSSVSSSKPLMNGQARTTVFSRGTSLSDSSEPNSDRQRAYSCSTDLGEDDVFSTSLADDDDIHICKSPKGYITVDAKSKHGYNRADGTNMANRALPVPGRPLSNVPEEVDLKENRNDTSGKWKKSRSSSKSSKTSRGSKNSHGSVTEQSEFPAVSHVMKNPHYAAPLNNNICVV